MSLKGNTKKNGAKLHFMQLRVPQFKGQSPKCKIQLGVVYIMDHEVVTMLEGHFSMVTLHGNTFMVRFQKNACLKSLGPWLGVNQM